MPGVVVAVGKDCNLLYGSEVWGIVQGAYAQYALAPCSLMTLKPFSFPLGKVGTIPITGETSCSVRRKRALLDHRFREWARSECRGGPP